MKIRVIEINILFLISGFLCLLQAQQPDNSGEQKTISEADIEFIENDSTAEEKEVVVIVECMPQFMGGGHDRFRKYIQDNMVYPEEAKQKKIEGRVFVQFTVKYAGDVTDVTILRGAHPLLDEEALRVVRSSPRWMPGCSRGKPTSVRFTFPVVFKLDEEDENTDSAN